MTTATRAALGSGSRTPGPGLGYTGQRGGHCPGRFFQRAVPPAVWAQCCAQRLPAVASALALRLWLRLGAQSTGTPPLEIRNRELGASGLDAGHPKIDSSWQTLDINLNVKDRTAVTYVVWWMSLKLPTTS